MEETFPFDVGIYQLSDFLATYSLFKDPELRFDETNEQFIAIIDSESSSMFKYALTDREIIDIEFSELPEFEYFYTFDLSHKHLVTGLKAASLGQFKNLTISSDGDSVILSTENSDMQSSNRFVTKVGKGMGEKFVVNFELDELKLLAADYVVQLSKDGVTRFTSTTEIPVEYLISAGNGSDYGV